VSRRRSDLRAQIESRRARLEEKNARVTKRAGRNLVFAAASGILLAAVFLVALFAWVPLLYILGLVLGSLCLIELVGAFRGSGLRVPRVGVTIAGLVIVSAAWFYGVSGLLFGLAIASVFLVLWRLIESVLPGFSVSWRTLLIDVFAGLFCLIYIPFLFSIALLLRLGDRGEWWVFTLILLPVCADIGAYAAGVTLGKHKMAPRVSPNKSWEGFAGAAIAAILAATAAAIFLLRIPWWIGPLLGTVVLLLATFGDLAESMIKRNLGIKDMSSWVPGHGGLLDRLDSILPSIVGVYGFALAVGVVV
jgi:phosphatidate cytidylyltransferase